MTPIQLTALPDGPYRIDDDVRCSSTATWKHDA